MRLPGEHRNIFPDYTVDRFSGTLFWWWLFSSHARSLGEGSTIHSPPAIFFFKVEIRTCTPVSLFRPGSVHSGTTSRDDCGHVFPEELSVNSFPG